MPYVLGLDPGQSGALALLSLSGKTLETWTFKKFSELELANIFSSLPEISFACLEKVNAMPGQGVTSMFTFGQSYGFLRGLLSANKIPFELVLPQKWQKEIGLTGKFESKTERKNALKSLAQRLYPREPITLGNADAILLAEYGRRLTLSRLSASLDDL